MQERRNFVVLIRRDGKSPVSAESALRKVLKVLWVLKSCAFKTAFWKTADICRHLQTSADICGPCICVLLQFWQVQARDPVAMLPSRSALQMQSLRWMLQKASRRSPNWRRNWPNCGRENQSHLQLLLPFLQLLKCFRASFLLSLPRMQPAIRCFPANPTHSRAKALTERN